jgi:hypothetical protein
MRFEVPFREAEVHRAERVDLTPRLVAMSTFEGVRAALVYWTFYIRPVVQGLLAPTPAEEAVLGFLYRAIGYLTAIRRLDAPVFVQSVAAAARSLFELGLDVHVFIADSAPDSLSRLLAFTRIERYRAAKNVVEFYAQREVPAELRTSLEQQRQHVADQVEQATVERLVREHWGTTRNGRPNWPRHWSRYADVRSRASHAGPIWEERYIQHYYMLSWHVHSGLTGVANMPASAFDAFGVEAHRLATAVVVDCYRRVGALLHLEQAIADWPRHLEFLELVAGFALVDRRLGELGEQPRFLYLEGDEAAI